MFYIFGNIRRDDGCFVQPKHVSDLVFKFVCQLISSLVLRKQRLEKKPQQQ